jgi:hypothetical protein
MERKPVEKARWAGFWASIFGGLEGLGRLAGVLAIGGDSVGAVVGSTVGDVA